MQHDAFKAVKELQELFHETSYTEMVELAASTQSQVLDLISTEDTNIINYDVPAFFRNCLKIIKTIKPLIDNE